MFSCEFCEISKNTFFTEHLWTTASEEFKHFVSIQRENHINEVCRPALASKLMFSECKGFLSKTWHCNVERYLLIVWGNFLTRI